MMKNIPAHCLAGMFFFSSFCQAGSIALATGLFEKGEWDLCRRECMRGRTAGEEHAGRLRLLEALCLNRSGAEPGDVIALLQPLVAENTDVETKALAAYELGRLHWQLDQPESALESLRLAFGSTADKGLFLHSACAMFQLMNEHKSLKQGREDLISQINTSRDQWYGPLFAETAKPDPAKNPPKAPNRVVRFYRSQISPAIGDRCVLEPSCSEYFTQAQHKHGPITAMAMTGDRFFREPDVSNKREEPVALPDGKIRYRDPIENHDFWMKKK